MTIEMSVIRECTLAFPSISMGDYHLDYFYARTVGCFVANRVEWDT